MKTARCESTIAVLLGVLWGASSGAAEKTAVEPVTEIGKLAGSMEPGEVRELETNNCNHDLFKMWYDWEEEDIKRYGSQKMFDVICWNNDMKWDPVTRQVLVINGGHYSSFKFITYSADRNAWRLMPVPPWMDPRRSTSTARRLPSSCAIRSVGNTSSRASRTSGCSLSIPCEISGKRFPAWACPTANRWAWRSTPTA
jgi:hypothetical protein